MKGFLLYLFLGMLAILLRTSVFPLFLPAGFCPDLLLGLIIYLGLSENMLRAVLLSLLLGGMQDSFSGTSLGLYVFVCLVILIAGLLIFADVGPVVGILLPVLPQQLLANLLASFLLLSLVLRLQPLFGNRAGLAGLVYQSKRHGT